MEKGKRYGKPVDIWAVGFMMYELIAGKHALWRSGDDNDSYRKKAQDYSSLRFGHRFNKFSQSLIEKLCHPKASLRYTVEQALQHPWITRNFDAEIPRNNFEKNVFLNETEEKLKRIFNLLFVLSVAKNQKPKPKPLQKPCNMSKFQISPIKKLERLINENALKNEFSLKRPKSKSQFNQTQPYQQEKQTSPAKISELSLEHMETPFFDKKPSRRNSNTGKIAQNP